MKQIQKVLTLYYQHLVVTVTGHTRAKDQNEASYCRLQKQHVMLISCNITCTNSFLMKLLLGMSV